MRGRHQVSVMAQNCDIQGNVPARKIFPQAFQSPSKYAIQWHGK